MGMYLQNREIAIHVHLPYIQRWIFWWGIGISWEHPSPKWNHCVIFWMFFVWGKDTWHTSHFHSEETTPQVDKTIWKTKKNGKQMNKGALTNHCQIQWPLRSFHIHPRYICSCDEKGCIYASIPIPSFPGCKPVAMAFIYEGIPDPSPKMFLKKHLYTYRDPRIPFKKHVMLSCHVRCVYVQNPSDPKNRMNMSNKSWWWRASQHPWVGGDRSIRPKTRACAAFTNQMDLGNGGEIHYTSPAV